jgi:hypothetical protein
MVVTALATALTNGWMEHTPALTSALKAGWLGLAARVAANGTVSGVSCGTGIEPDVAGYNGKCLYGHPHPDHITPQPLFADP